MSNAHEHLNDFLSGMTRARRPEMEQLQHFAGWRELAQREIERRATEVVRMFTDELLAATASGEADVNGAIAEHSPASDAPRPAAAGRLSGERAVNLTETQHTVLHAAATHTGGRIEQFARSVQGGTRAKVGRALLLADLVIADGADHWLTEAGYTAIGVEPPAPAAPTPRPDPRSPPLRCARSRRPRPTRPPNAAPARTASGRRSVRCWSGRRARRSRRSATPRSGNRTPCAAPSPACSSASSA